MKKIYILTAIFALLTLSLNAQLKVDQNGNVVQPKAQTVKAPNRATNSVTVGDQSSDTQYLPVYGYWYDGVQKNQMIYTAGQLGIPTGSKIKSITFYPYNGLLLNGGTIKFSLGTTTTSSFSSNAAISVSNLTEVATVSPTSNSSLTEWTITFTTDFTYNGDNLLVQIDTQDGSENRSYFYGTSQGSNNNVCFYSYGYGSPSNTSSSNILPKTTFTYEDASPKIEVSPETLTISDSGTNNTFTVEGSNLGTDNVGVTVPNGSAFSTTTSDQSWGFVNTTGSVSGTVYVTYNGRDLSATETVTAANNTGASATVAVTYVPDLYVVGNFGNGWDYSANGAVAMTHDGNGTYTATLQNIPADSYILFARATGVTYGWEGDANRLFIGASTDGGDWGYGANTSGYLDTDPTNDSPVKYHPIYFAEGGTYTITIDANAYTFTITKLVYPAPENVVATPNSENKTATVTWDVPSNLPTVPGTVNQSVTEDFEDQTTFPPFGLGDITSTNHYGAFGDWTLYDATGAQVYGSKQIDYENENAPHAWFVMYPSGATAASGYSGATAHATHSGAQYIESICPLEDPNDANSETPVAADHWLISPELSGKAQTITWWDCELTTDYGDETYEVWVSTTNNTAPSSFTKLVDYSINYTTWTQRSLQLPEGTKYFAIRHTSKDIFGMMIDDITYAIGVTSEVTVEPVSYNVYLDGQLVGSVNANDPLTYNFSNLAVGDHECAVSAVYPEGIESEAVPAQFNIMDRTAMPTISVVDNADGSKTVSATGNGTVHLYVDGVEVTNPYTIMPSSDGDISVTVTATAQEEGKLISETAEQIVTVHEVGRSPQPTITFTDNGDGTYTITVEGTGEIAVYIDDADHAGEPIATVNNTFSFNVEQHSQVMTITVTATNQEGDLEVSRPATETYTIPAMTIDSDFKLLDPQPETSESPIDLSKLMFVDRFSVDIPNDNSHPFMYEYTLEETQVRQRSSNTVEVYVEKTGSTGQGFYTLKQLDDDTDAELTMNVMNAAMDFNLSELSAPFFYTVEREEEADGETYWGWNAVLQRTSVGNYKQTLKYDSKGNLVYNYNDTILPGEHIQLDLDTITGDYNDYNAYVPVVWTMGFDRVNYNEDDPVHNSYGASVWTTGVAEVNMDSFEQPIAERQTNQWNSVNWEAEGGPASLFILDNVVATAKMPTVNTLEYEPYMFRIFVRSENGKLRHYDTMPQGEGPYDGEHVVAADGSTEGPWCVWSGYVNDPANEAKGVEISITEGDKEYNIPTTITFKKSKVDRENTNVEWTLDDYNAIFGALDEISDGLNQGQSINTKDLEIFVRFYYVVKGSAEGHTPWLPTRDGGNGDSAGYGAESGGGSAGVATSVNEIRYHGDVVSQSYYNIQGMKSDKPFEGVNIVVTRYSDGATVVSKVVK